MIATDSRRDIRFVTMALLLAAAMLLGSKLLAQAPPAPSQAERDQQLADILTRHSDLTDAARLLGEATYKGHCAACHDGGLNRAPTASALGYIAPGAIVRVLTSGKMREQGSSLSQDEKVAVAEFLSGRMIDSASAPGPKMCASDENWFDAAQPPVVSGWGLDDNNGHAIPASFSGLTRANVGQLKLKWAFGFPDALYSRSQPAIAGGALFVGGDDGNVYALDPDSGCAHWAFHATGPVRMGIVTDSWKAGDGTTPQLYFGDILGNAYALNLRTGEQVWRKPMDAHQSVTLTGSPALDDGVLYWPISSLEEPAAADPAHECCTFRGAVAALDAASGDEQWRAYMVDEPIEQGTNENGVARYGPSGVAIWSTPLVDPKRGLVYVTTGDNYSSPATELSDAIVAIDIKTGDIRWSHQATENDAWNVACGWAGEDTSNCPEEAGPDFDFGSPPIMAQGSDGRDYLLAGQKSGALFALDPDSGEVRWHKRIGRGGTFGGIHFGIAAANGKVFVPMSDLADGALYDWPARPGLYALDVATGEQAWAVGGSPDTCSGKRFCHPGYGAAITLTNGLVLAGAMDGHIRIFDAETGKLLWDRDTDIAYTTVNGTEAHGGSFAGGAGPLAWDGRLILNSGYGGLGKMPGNVMLVFDTK